MATNTTSDQVWPDDSPRQVVTRPFLVATLVTAFSVGLLGILARVTPDGPWVGLGILIFLVSLQAAFTTEWLSGSERLKLNRATYRLAELVVILLALRLFLWYVTGNWPRLVILRQILLDPLQVLDAFFFGMALVVSVAWGLSITWSGLLRQFSLTPYEIAYYLRPARERVGRGDAPRDLDRSEVARDFGRQWIIGGTVLVFFAAAGAYDVASINEGFNLEQWRTIRHLGLSTPVVLALCLYFLLGFWILSQARLASLRVRWLTGGTRMSQQLPARWRRLSWLLLLAVAVVASLLPIGSTFALSRIVSAILFVAFQIVATLLFLFNLLLALPLSWLLGLAEPGEAETEVAPEFTMPPAPPPAAEPSETFALAMGTLFWIVLVIGVTAALIFFLRERGYRLDAGWLASGWRILTAWLRSLWQQGNQQAGRLASAMRRRQSESADGRESNVWRFTRPGALPPREQVRLFYISLVRRAGEKGLERRGNQTPLEYAQTLAQAWPEAEADVEKLTGAFIEARYSRHEIEESQLGRIKAAWRRLRRFARRWQK